MRGTTSLRFRTLALALALLPAAACLRFSPAPGLAPPAVVLERMALCAAIDQKENWAQPAAEKTVFEKGKDANAVSFLSFRDFHGRHTLVWKWYDPARRLYRVTDGIEIGEEGKMYEKYIAWDMIYVSEDKAAGIWTATVFLDGALLVSREFEIK